MLSRLELRRQLLHMGFGIFLVMMLYLGIFTVVHLAIILFLGLLLSQICVHYHVPVASWVMDNFERKEFRKTFPGKGPILFLLGSLIVVLIFPLKIALASMMILSLGDAVSHIFGKLLSRRTYKYLKSVEGTLLAILFSFIGALLFVNVAAALASSVLSMLFEDLKTGIDDNVWIPLIAASVMVLISLF